MQKCLEQFSQPHKNFYLSKTIFEVISSNLQCFCDHLRKIIEMDVLRSVILLFLSVGHGREPLLCGEYHG